MSDKGEITQMEKFDVWFNREWREYISGRPRVQRIALRNIAWHAWQAALSSKQEEA
ncbi:MAG: hypothetical protein ACJ8LD_19970 [Pantoea agglomerans]